MSVILLHRGNVTRSGWWGEAGRPNGHLDTSFGLPQAVSPRKHLFFELPRSVDLAAQRNGATLLTERAGTSR
jgi:hypothetical protein